MTFNPYITQHYGSSMELMSGGRDGSAEGKEDEVDAAVGFRRFPNAAHMTHTVFKPKNAPAASSSSSSGGGVGNTYNAPKPATTSGAGGATGAPSSGSSYTFTPYNNGFTAARVDVSDVLATLRQHRGVPIDNFPSRPVTPKGNNSLASLPPLLPTDRSSAGSLDSLRDRGAGLMRNWVKAAAPSDSSSTSSSSAPSAAAEAASSAPPAPVSASAVAAAAVSPQPPNTGNVKTTAATPAASTAATCPAATHDDATRADNPREENLHQAASGNSTPSPANVIEEGDTECLSEEKNHAPPNLAKRGLRAASPPRLPVTATAFFRAVPPPADAAVAPSVSISPVSPQLGSNAHTTPANESPVPTPAPEAVEEGEPREREANMDTAMDWMLQRSKEALEHVQRVLGESPASTSTARPLAPPPPLTPPEHLEETTSHDTPLMASAPKREGAPAAILSGRGAVSSVKATAAAAEAEAGGSDDERSPEDSLDFVSPLSANHNVTRGFPASAEAGSAAALSRVSMLSALAHPHAGEAAGAAAAVPEGRRYMVLSRVADPAAMAAQRHRRRHPAAQPPLDASGVRTSPCVPYVCETRAARERPAARQGEVAPSWQKTSGEAAATGALTGGDLMAQPHLAASHEAHAADSLPRSPSRSSFVSAAAHKTTQKRRASPQRVAAASADVAARPRAIAAASTAAPAVPPPPKLSQDPSLLQELADFLRAGNASGFSNLSAALATPTAAPSSTAAANGPGEAAAAVLATTSTTPSTQSPHTRPVVSRRPPRPATQPSRRDSSAHARAAAAATKTASATAPAAGAVVPPAPVVLLGQPPPSLSRFDRSFTPSSQLARVNASDAGASLSSAAAAAAGASGVVVGGVSPRRGIAARPHRSGAAPSYAQPTISWLSKGSEASADDFPVTHATPALTSLAGESETA